MGAQKEEAGLRDREPAVHSWGTTVLERCMWLLPYFGLNQSEREGSFVQHSEKWVTQPGLMIPFSLNNHITQQLEKAETLCRGPQTLID